MRKLITVFIFIALANSVVACSNRPKQVHLVAEIEVGAEQVADYLPLIEGQRVAVLANHSSMVGEVHLVDMLHQMGCNITGIFAPEHGFRGQAQAGEHVANGIDPQTGISILSLYDGRNRHPSAKSMASFDVLLIDIQDVGLRFYTYYITMLNMMEACAEARKKVIVLDRPNPNGFYVDGPILDMKYRSGVGRIPVPVVHGLTMAEIAVMSNELGWLDGGVRCDLHTVKCRNYSRSSKYQLPIPPSPNLPNMTAIYLYPSLCLFEATPVSVGRGTDRPFQCYGHPDMRGEYSFTPTAQSSAYTPLNGKLCRGI